MTVLSRWFVSCSAFRIAPTPSSIAIRERRRSNTTSSGVAVFDPSGGRSLVLRWSAGFPIERFHGTRPARNLIPDKQLAMSFCGYESFGFRKIDTTIIVLHHFGMNCFVCEVDEKRFVMPSFNKLNCVSSQRIRYVTLLVNILAVFVNLGVYIIALAFKAYPAIKAGAWRVVVSHVPLAYESRRVTCLL